MHAGMGGTGEGGRGDERALHDGQRSRERLARLKSKGVMLVGKQMWCRYRWGDLLFVMNAGM